MAKEPVLERVPPGDKWRDIRGEADEIFISLTDGLQYVFEVTGVTEFHISAKEGKVYKVMPDPPPKPAPPKKYSLYDED